MHPLTKNCFSPLIAALALLGLFHPFLLLPLLDSRGELSAGVLQIA